MITPASFVLTSARSVSASWPAGDGEREGCGESVSGIGQYQSGAEVARPSLTAAGLRARRHDRGRVGRGGENETGVREMNSELLPT